MTETDIHKILSQALDADESGNKDLAISLYTKSVEGILQIMDPDIRGRLNKYAKQALDRAEELKGIKRTDVVKFKPPQLPSPKTVIPVTS